MLIDRLEKEFSDFCARISEREFERNPTIKNEIGAIRRMIWEIRGRVQKPERKAEMQAARRAIVVFR